MQIKRWKTPREREIWDEMHVSSSVSTLALMIVVKRFRRKNRKKTYASRLRYYIGLCKGVKISIQHHSTRWERFVDDQTVSSARKLQQSELLGSYLLCCVASESRTGRVSLARRHIIGRIEIESDKSSVVVSSPRKLSCRRFNRSILSSFAPFFSLERTNARAIWTT